MEHHMDDVLTDKQKSQLQYLEKLLAEYTDGAMYANGALSDPAQCRVLLGKAETFKEWKGKIENCGYELSNEETG